MNKELGLKILAEVMSWSDEQAQEEYAWLNMMARIKYDGYRDFQAGMRFVESLITWLQQFSKEERGTAYDFIRKNLVYVSPSELQKLVEQFYPKIIRNRIVKSVSEEKGIASYLVDSSPDATKHADLLKRKILIMGLSDGARIDSIRHANVGIISNEQCVVSTEANDKKWQGLLNDLRSDTKDDNAKFSKIYLVDDFMATGTSFLRYDEEKGQWKGKLPKFKDALEAAHKIGALAENWELCIHHYIATASARDLIEERIENFQKSIKSENWAKKIHPSYGIVFGELFPINKRGEDLKDFIALTEKYYSSSIETKHTKVGGTQRINLGYGGCALPLILEHNTPNNSVALLWAEADSDTDKMVPLFRRRQRHL